jgi:flagellar biosynthesis repressor protein FlbT
VEWTGRREAWESVADVGRQIAAELAAGIAEAASNSGTNGHEPMSLKITLKSNERLIVGGAVVKNGGKGIVLFIENTVPILREKDIMGEKDANTPCKRVYFTVQLMYIDEPNVSHYRVSLADQVREIVQAAPSTTSMMDQLNERIEAGNFYQALKAARNLIEYEEELLKNAN